MRFKCFAAATVSLAVAFGAFLYADAAPPVQSDISSMFDSLQGEGTAEDPYLVCSESELLHIADRINAGDTAYASAYYRQTAPIALTAFAPIGTAENPFSGTYDGQGYPVRFEAVPTFTDTAYAGLFGYANKASFLNIVLVGDLSVTDSKEEELFAGLLCGYYTSARRGDAYIRNCEALGNVTAQTSSGTAYAGGLIGQMRLSGGTVAFSDCYAEGNVASTGKYSAFSGGICGFTRAATGSVVTYTRCIFNGEASSEGKTVSGYSGGITGYFMQDGAWISSLSSLLADENYNLSDCAASGSICANGALETHLGSLSGYVNSDVTANNVYAALSSAAYSKNTLNGKAVEAETLFSSDFFADTLNFDVTGTWIPLADKSGARLKSEYIELIRIRLAADQPQTLRFQPINCEEGLFTAAFYDDSGRMLHARSVAFSSETPTFFTTLPENAGNYRVFLFADSKSLRPLIAKPLDLTA